MARRILLDDQHGHIIQERLNLLFQPGPMLRLFQPIKVLSQDDHGQTKNSRFRDITTNGRVFSQEVRKS